MKLRNVFLTSVVFFLVGGAANAISLLDAILNSTLGSSGGNRVVLKRINAAARIVRKFGCDPNICYAIDGSKQLGANDFDIQNYFITFVTAIIGADEHAQFSGVQYGHRTSVIRNLRDNADDFLLDIEKVRWMKSRRSFIGGGVAYCAQQLGKHSGVPAKMVVFGDGRSNYGNLGGPQGPAAVAKQFRERSPANNVYAVAVGFSRTDLFKEIVGDGLSLLLKVTEWHKVFDILTDLVRGICDVDIKVSLQRF